MTWCLACARARYGVLVVGEEMKGLVNCNFLPGSARRLELGTGFSNQRVRGEKKSAQACSLRAMN
jgi:hypothetical protein